MRDNSGKTVAYQVCFVAYLDILGFKAKVLQSQESSVVLELLVDSLKVCGGFPSGEKKISDGFGAKRMVSVQSRFFSDSIVLFMKENPKDLAQLFFMIRYLQDRLWEKGICLRGAVTIGDMYWSELEKNVTLGPALVEAYKLESEFATNPRILVSDQLYGYIDTKNPEAEPFGLYDPMKILVRLDVDNRYFLDLLNKQITRARDEKLHSNEGVFSIQWTTTSGSYQDDILHHCETMIADHIESIDDKIKHKYEWLKNYKDVING